MSEHNYFDKTSTTGATLRCAHFDYRNPTPAMIFLADVALGLSRESRFNGQTLGDRPWLVGQHSVLVLRRVEDLIPGNHLVHLEALMHDGSEFACKDIPRPLKHLLPEYKVIEKGIDRAIRQKLGLPLVESSIVMATDRRMLATECRDLVPPHPDYLEVLEVFPPYPERIIPIMTGHIWEPDECYDNFVFELKRLLKKLGKEELWRE